MPSTTAVAWAAGYDPDDDVAVVAQVAELLADDAPDVTLAYLVATDLAGHAHGWDSDEYAVAAELVDVRLGELFDAAGDELAIVVTTDHGGVGRHHGDPLPGTLETFVAVRSRRLAAGGWWPAASILDIAPTVTDLARRDARPMLGGRQPARPPTTIRRPPARTSGLDVGPLLRRAGRHARSTRCRPPPAPSSPAPARRSWWRRCCTTSATCSAMPANGVFPITPRPGPAPPAAGCRPGWWSRSACTSPPSATSSPPTRATPTCSAGPRSTRSAEQGGPLPAGELAAFESERFAADALALRRCDDGGKLAGHVRGRRSARSTVVPVAAGGDVA